MQINTYNENTLEDLIDESSNIAIIPAKVAGADAFCAGVALYYMLREKLEDFKAKNVSFVYTKKIPQGCEGLIKDEEITYNLKHRNLIISVDYSDTSAAKIQYSTQDDILHLKLGPVSKNFNKNRVKTKITGFNFDLILIVGAQELEDLGPIYQNLRDEIARAKIVNIDNTNKNKRFGIVNVIDTHADTLSNLVFKKAPQWKMQPKTTAAKAMLTGMSINDKKA